MKVILFIGHHKVGSTSLQDYLSRNSVALAKAGILYPYVDFEGMAYMAGVAAGRHQVEGGLPINVREPHNALAFRMLADEKDGKVPPYHKKLPGFMQMINAIHQQVDVFQPHTVILAAEVFANFAAVNPALIGKLVRHFPGAEFTVMATLRRIDEYLASWHGQRLKFGHQVSPLHENGGLTYSKGIHFNYRRMVESWLDSLPDAQVILRNYADVAASGGSVVDFTKQTGLQLPDGLAEERRENDSLHRGFYDLVCRGNAALPHEVAADLRRTLRHITPALKLPRSNQIELFGSAHRQNLVDKFQPIDAYLGELIGQDSFFADLEEARETLPVAEAEVYQAALAQLCETQDWCDTPQVMQFLTELQQNSRPRSS